MGLQNDTFPQAALFQQLYDFLTIQSSSMATTVYCFVAAWLRPLPIKGSFQLPRLQGLPCTLRIVKPAVAGCSSQKRVVRANRFSKNIPPMLHSGMPPVSASNCVAICRTRSSAPGVVHDTLSKTQNIMRSRAWTSLT